MSRSVQGSVAACSFTGERPPHPGSLRRPQPGPLPEVALRAPPCRNPSLHMPPARHPSCLPSGPGKKINRCPRSQLFLDTWACTLTEHTSVHTALTRIPPRAHTYITHTRARTSHSGTHLGVTQHVTLPCAQNIHAHTSSHIPVCVYSTHVAQRSGQPAFPTQPRAP